MKLSHLLLSLVLLTGCSVLDTVKGVADIALGEQPALSVDAQIGDKTSNIGKTDNSTIEVGDNEGNLTVTSTKSDKSFAKTEKVIINEGPDIFWASYWSLDGYYQLLISYLVVLSHGNKTDSV